LVAPDLGVSLISWRKFDDAGAKLESKNEKCWIKKDGELLLEADKKKRASCIGLRNLRKKAKLQRKWMVGMRCLGHVGKKAIKGYLNVYNINEKEGSALCDVCSKTKQTKKPIKSVFIQNNRTWTSDTF
jgi:hypothetical protein